MIIGTEKAKIIDYLNGLSDIEKIGVSRKNGPQMLAITKQIDQERELRSKTSTYALRTHILRMCSPEMSTAEAYTKTLDPKEIADYTYLKNIHVWVPERVRIHAKVIANQFALVMGLSKRFKSGMSEVNAIRGGTAVGKTHFLSKSFYPLLDHNGELTGCLSPDPIKADLKQLGKFFDQVDLVNTQVYLEGTAIFALFQQAISEQALHLKIIVDTRLISLDYFESSVIEPAIRRNGKARLIDLDSPLETSINRVLVRDPYGKDPCVPLSAIISGFSQIRENRQLLIRRIQETTTVSHYILFYTNKRGKRIFVAEKKENRFKVLNPKILEKCTKKPSESSIKQIIKQKVTSEYIDQAVRKGDITSDQKKEFERWKGKTLAHAMGRHVRGNAVNTDEQVFVSKTISTLRDLHNIFVHLSELSDEHFSDLFLKAKQGDCSNLEAILDLHDDVNEPRIQEAMTIAAIIGQPEVVDLLLVRGVEPSPHKSYDIFKHATQERLTPLGHAIEQKHLSVVNTLLEEGLTIKSVTYDTYFVDTALDLFFNWHKLTGPNVPLLKRLLSEGANPQSISKGTIFKIGIYASSEELHLLLKAGLDPHFIYTGNSKALDEDETFSSENPFPFMRIEEVNLLDLAILQAEKENLFKDHPDSIKKVALLLRYKADAKKRTWNCHWSYLHQVSHPELVRILCNAGAKVSSSGLLYLFKKKVIKPIDIASDKESIAHLCAFGENPSNAPFLKGSKAHKKALTRIGFKQNKGLDQRDEKGLSYLIKAIEKEDICAFLALIGAGVDVNQTQREGSSWTCLHYLFSKLNNQGSINEQSDYISIPSHYEVRFINLLIKHGAKPLKDSREMTPLMYLNLNSANNGFNNQVYDYYLDFEADFHQIPYKEHQKSIFELRKLRQDSTEFISSFANRFKNF